MPIFYYVCTGCAKKRATMGTDAPVTCICGGTYKRAPKVPTTSTYEVIDNGIMPRKVERLKDAQAMSEERSINDPQWQELQRLRKLEEENPQDKTETPVFSGPMDLKVVK